MHITNIKNYYIHPCVHLIRTCLNYYSLVFNCNMKHLEYTETFDVWLKLCYRVTKINHKIQRHIFLQFHPALNNSRPIAVYNAI